jgi:spermidine/putrescine transport system ATP-binding protein
MSLIDIRNATRRYGQLSAVDNVTLQIDSGEFFTLLGPSGCGKSTLLRLLGGFEPPDQGQIFIDGKDMAGVAPEMRPLHTVFQNYALFPHMTVAENIAFPLRMSGVARNEIPGRVEKALAEVRLPHMTARYPHELSGGQRQRVAIARALIDKPQLLLLDEPLAALDRKLREQMRVELIKLQQEVGITFVYVTHDQGEALALSHRIAVMNEGRIVQLDTPSAIYEFPCNRFVADFIGSCNLVDATVIAIDGKTVELSAAGVGTIRARCERALPNGQRGVLALRPEQIKISGAPLGCANAFYGVIRQLIYLGDVTRYHIELTDGTSLEALLPNSTAAIHHHFDSGDSVHVGWPLDAGRFLDV